MPKDTTKQIITIYYVKSIYYILLISVSYTHLTLPTN